MASNNERFIQFIQEWIDALHDLYQAFWENNDKKKRYVKAYWKAVLCDEWIIVILGLSLILSWLGFLRLSFHLSWLGLGYGIVEHDLRLLFCCIWILWRCTTTVLYICGRPLMWCKGYCQAWILGHWPAFVIPYAFLILSWIGFLYCIADPERSYEARQLVYKLVGAGA